MEFVDLALLLKDLSSKELLVGLATQNGKEALGLLVCVCTDSMLICMLMLGY